MEAIDPLNEYASWPQNETLAETIHRGTCLLNQGRLSLEGFKYVGDLYSVEMGLLYLMSNIRKCQPSIDYELETMLSQFLVGKDQDNHACRLLMAVAAENAGPLLYNRLNIVAHSACENDAIELRRSNGEWHQFIIHPHGVNQQQRTALRTFLESHALLSKDYKSAERALMASRQNCSFESNLLAWIGFQIMNKVICGSEKCVSAAIATLTPKRLALSAAQRSESLTGQ